MDVDRSIFFVIFIFIFDLLLLPFFSFDIDQSVHHIMFLFLIEATAISFLQLDALLQSMSLICGFWTCSHFYLQPSVAF